MTDIHHQHVLLRWRELAELASGIQPTQIPVDCRPSEILAVKDDLELLAKRVDALLLAIGQQVIAYGGGNKDDLTYFTDRLWGDLQGNATYVVDAAAQETRERMQEVA